MTSSTPTPVYDDAYYRDYDGQRYDRSEPWMAQFRHCADRIVTTLGPVTTLDAGCAIGLLVETLDERGVEASGFDISEYAISQVPERLQARCRVGSLTEPIDGRYDLITCIEVIEHLPASDAHDAVANLCSATDTVLLSSTPTEHEEPTHLNVQPPEYWSALFAAHGFLRDTEYDATYVSPWAVLYRRRPVELPEVVRSYDRAWWRLRDENQRVRAALLETTDRAEALSALLTDDELEAVRASADPIAELQALTARLGGERSGGAWGAARYDELQQELIAERGRRMVMRDELLGATARAGEMAARLEELNGELAAHATLRQRYAELEGLYNAMLRSRTWLLTRKALAPYRRLRGQP